jgi:hypothetical protein
VAPLSVDLKAPELVSASKSFMARPDAVLNGSSGYMPGLMPPSRADFVKWLLREDLMRTLLVAVVLATFSFGGALAQGTCESRALDKNGKVLSGAAKTSFIQKCKRDACAAKATDKNGKALAGAAKKSFMDKCEKEA